MRSNRSGLARFAALVVMLAAAPARAEDDPGMAPAPVAPASPAPDGIAAPTDDPEGHVARAIGAVRAQRFEEALREYQAAYALRQAPDLLYALGLTAQRLGRAPEAVDYFRRFLVAATDAPAEQRADVQRRVDALKPMADLFTVPTFGGGEAGGIRYVPMKYEMRPNWKLIGGGIGLLSAAYSAAFITGSILVSVTSNSSSSPQGNIQAASGTLLVPVAGPFLSGALFRETFWSLPWILVDGAAQVSGLAMIVMGAKNKQRTAVPVLGNMQILPYAGPGGGGLVAAGTF